MPTLHKKQLSRVPRSLSSAYLRGALECDLQSDGVSCMMDCLNQGSDTWKVLANLWDAGGGKLGEQMQVHRCHLSFAMPERGVHSSWAVANDK